MNTESVFLLVCEYWSVGGLSVCECVAMDWKVGEYVFFCAYTECADVCGCVFV